MLFYIRYPGEMKPPSSCLLLPLPSLSAKPGSSQARSHHPVPFCHISLTSWSWESSLNFLIPFGISSCTSCLICSLKTLLCYSLFKVHLSQEGKEGVTVHVCLPVYFQYLELCLSDDTSQELNKYLLKLHEYLRCHNYDCYTEQKSLVLRKTSDLDSFPLDGSLV